MPFLNTNGKAESITCSSPPSKVRLWGYQEAYKKWKDEKQVAFAAHCVEEAHAYMQSLPPGYAAAKPRCEINKEVTEHLRKDVLPSHYSFWQRVGIAALAIVFWPVTLDVIIAWAIVKTFDIHFGEEEQV